MRLHFRPVVLPATLSAVALAAVTVAGQSAPAATPPAQAPAPAPAPPPGPPPLTPEQQAARAKLQEESRADHADMMKQLGITSLRPGRNSASRPAQRRQLRRGAGQSLPEAARADGAEERHQGDDQGAVGDAPQGAARGVRARGRGPHAERRAQGDVDGRGDRQHARSAASPSSAGALIGRPDNGGAPDIKVEISLIVVTPATADKPVPVMIMFRGGQLPGPPGSPALDFFGRPVPPPGPGEDPPGTEQLIEAGWGYAFLNPSSVQADNGAGLTKGIIGLVNKGQRAQAGGLGLAARVGLGREPRPRLLRDRQDDRRQARSASTASRATARRRW